MRRSQHIQSGNTNSAENPEIVTALARGLEVLAAFRTPDRLLGNLDLAQKCGLPRSTVSRLTHTLTTLGYLDHVESAGKYRLGMATLGLGATMREKLDVRVAAQPLMNTLAGEMDVSVALASRLRLSMVYVEACRGQAVITLALETGARLPLATTAIGRAYLATCSPEERNRSLQTIRAATEAKAWPRVRAGVETAVEETAERGYCTSFGDWQKDINAIAVGFVANNGLPPMAISCGGPTFTTSTNYLEQEVAPRLLALRTELLRRLA